MRLPRDTKERYDVYNLCSSVLGSVASLLLFSTLSVASIVPLVFSVPMICLLSAIAVSSCISLFSKIKLANKPQRHVSWADQIAVTYEAPAEIFTCSI